MACLLGGSFITQGPKVVLDTWSEWRAGPAQRTQVAQWPALATLSLPPGRRRWKISGPLTFLCTPPPTPRAPLSLPPCKELPAFGEIPQHEVLGLQQSAIRIFAASWALSGSRGPEGQGPSSARPGPSSQHWGPAGPCSL